MSYYFSYFQKDQYDFGQSIVKDVTNFTKYTAIFSQIANDISFYTYYTAQGGERLDEISQTLYDTPDFYWTIPLVNDRIVNIWNDTSKSYADFIAYLEKKYVGRAFILKDDETLAGKFLIGENLVYNSTETAELVAKYPTQGYMQVVFSENASFPQNTEFTVVGETSGDSITVTNHIPTYNAPIRHVDLNGNFVPYDSGQVTPITIRQEEEDRNEINSQIRVIRPEFIYDVASRFEQEMRRRRRRS